MGNEFDEIREVILAQAKSLNELTTALKEKELHTKTPANAGTAPLLHGSGGNFSNPAFERDVISARITPYGISQVLPFLPSTIEDPRFASITGYTAVVGSEPTTPCADAPYGFMKGAALTARFAMTRRDTNTIDIGKVMLQWNRGDTRDLVLRGRVLGLTNLAPSGLETKDVLNILTESEMVGAGAQAEMKLSRDIWQGTVAAGTGPGLDVQIATGQMDADTQTLAPALDSDIKNFAYDLLGGTGRDIVEFLSSMMYYLEYNAEHMGLSPVNYVLAMRPELWFELTAVWPCSYLSNRCKTSAGSNVTVINDNVNVAMRDQMRDSMTMPINGKTYRVVTDTGIFEKNNVNTAGLNAGQYASAIYAIPMTITGNFPVCYREYLDYRGISRDAADLNGTQMFWTDDGIYLWASEVVKYCYKLSLRTEQRIVLRTPQLAGKIQNIKYTPLQHLRETYPDSQYNFDGGVSVRGQSFGKAVWS
jgi:hypothetical protein